MSLTGKLFVGFVLQCCFLVANGQEDSVQDCSSNFFQHAPTLPSTSKIVLVTNLGKTVSLAKFMGQEDRKQYGQYGLMDLDQDGQHELLVTNYTGGAHCCDEIYLFKKTAVDTYRQVAKMIAGDVCMIAQNRLVFNFHQQLGYFFTCFACSYEDSTGAAPIPVRSIELMYKKGGLTIVPGSQELRSTIHDNLAVLKEQPYVKIDPDLGQDNGIRKEFAMNLAVYYFSFGKHLLETQQLFNKYYTFPDARKVWVEWVKQLNYIRSQNSF